MSEHTKPAIGSIGWTDLTVDDATGLVDFYRSVVGWTTSEIDMGGYPDFCVNEPDSGKTVAGICHARGVNAGLPAQWLVYIVVGDLDASLAACTANGGELLSEVRTMGDSRMCVIRDPAGAVAALFQS